MKKVCFLFTFLLIQTLINAQVVNFTADTTQGCVPFMVEFTAQNQSAYQYHWDFGDGSQSSLSKPSHLFLNPGKYSIKLIVITANGTDSLVKQEFIEVNEIPQISFDVLDFSQCLNSDSVSFINYSDTSNQYTWSFGDGGNLQAYEGTYHYSTPGQYQVTLFAESPSGCTNAKSLSQGINVIAGPDADFMVSDSIICQAGQVVSYGSLSSNLCRHKWTFGDGNTDSIHLNPQHIYHTEGSFDVKLEVTDSAGCTDVNVKKELITYKKVKQPQIYINEDTLCNAQTVVFNSDSSWFSAKWDFGDGDSSVSQIKTTHRYDLAGHYLPSVTLIDSIGCKVEKILDSLQVFQRPVANIRSNNVHGCSPLEVRVSNTSFNSDDYLWKLDSNLSTDVEPIFYLSKEGSYKLELIASNKYCSDTLIIDNFAEVESAEAKILLNDSTGCAPHSVNFKLEGGPFTNIYWDFGNGDTSNQKSPQYTYESGGVFKPMVIAETANGCKDTTYYDYEIQVVDEQSIFSLPDTVVLCEPGSVSFDGYSVGGNFWNWQFGDGDSSVIANPIHYYDSAGTYVVELITENTNGCYYRLKPYNVVVVKNPEIDFMVYEDPCPFYQVDFTSLDTSAVEWFWSFGDGSTDSVSNPTHFYSGPGYYNVSLSTWDKDGCFSKHMKLNGVELLTCVNGNPSGDGLSGGNGGIGAINDSAPPIIACAPFEIKMIMPFDSVINQWWDFGDGATSSLQEPTHLYSNGGRYTLSLITEFPKGKFDTIVKTNFIQLGDPEAAFNFEVENGCDSSRVQFINKSLGASSYSWHLGTRGNSNLFEPQAVYQQESNQLISLMAIDDYGCIDRIHQNIAVGSPNPFFGFTNNLCLGSSVTIISNISHYDSLEWSIGGYYFNTDTVQFTPTDTGKYQILLKAFDRNGCFKEFDATKSLFVHDPTADFSFVGQTEHCDQYQLQLTNLSTGANKYTWYFGNGDSSENKVPQYKYSKEGSFQVRLLAEKAACRDLKTANQKVVVNKAHPDFEVIQNKKCLPFQVQFIDKSDSAISWKWSFGDGDSSILQNPSHFYSQEPGTQSLQIVDYNGCTGEINKSAIDLHQADPIADHWEGCVPLTIQFEDTTDNIIEYYWDFGDGHSSQLRNPTHTYTQAGEYDLRLITRSVEGCYDTLKLPESIVAGDVKAEFSSPSERNNCAPHLVQFENLSSGANEFKWLFGDGRTSTSEIPTYVYHKAGNFDVSLIASNGHSCSDTLSKHQYINVNTPEVAFTLSDSISCGPMKVRFNDKSSRVESRVWYFGDGSTSNLKSPLHDYQDTGLYSVSLMVTDTAKCTEHLTKTIRIKQRPKANFSLDSINGCIPATIGFRNHSSHINGATFDWKVNHTWLKNAVDTSLVFDREGRFDIGLVARNKNGCKDTLVKKDHLSIFSSQKPDQPQIKSISRNLNQDWIINWEENEAFQFSHYVLYRKTQNGTYENYITFWDQSRTTYTISNNPDWESRQCFKLEVVYYCYSSIGIDSLEEYCSIDLEVKAEIDYLDLSWTTYHTEEVGGYEIWRSSSTNYDFERIGTTDGDKFTYRDSTLLCPEQYVYRVKAMGVGGENFFLFSDTAQAIPMINTIDNINIEVKSATVVDDNSVLLEWDQCCFSDQVVEGVRILKSQPRGGSVIIDEVPAYVTAYIDRNASVHERAIEYTLSLNHKCHHSVKVEQKLSSIWLRVEQNGDINYLRWTQANGLKGGVKQYLIQRLNSVGTWETVKIVGEDELETYLEAK